MRKPSYWHTHFGGRWKYVVSIRNLFPRRIRKAVGLAEWIKLSVVIRWHCNLLMGDVFCVPLSGEYRQMGPHDKHLSLFLLRWHEALGSADPWGSPWAGADMEIEPEFWPMWCFSLESHYFTVTLIMKLQTLNIDISEQNTCHLSSYYL